MQRLHIVFHAREALCRSCATPCSNQTDKAWLADPCSSCPLPKSAWSTWDCRKDARPLGLGDAVARVANPIARVLDATLGTKIVGCGGCAKRQAALNELGRKLMGEGEQAKPPST